MISFSTGKLRENLFQLLKLRQIRGKNWGYKLVKSSDELVTSQMIDSRWKNINNSFIHKALEDRGSALHLLHVLKW